MTLDGRCCLLRTNVQDQTPAAMDPASAADAFSRLSASVLFVLEGCFRVQVIGSIILGWAMGCWPALECDEVEFLVSETEDQKWAVRSFVAWESARMGHAMTGAVRAAKSWCWSVVRA